MIYTEIWRQRRTLRVVDLYHQQNRITVEGNLVEKTFPSTHQLLILLQREQNSKTWKKKSLNFTGTSRPKG
jgi:hypothetical protein